MVENGRGKLTGKVALVVGPLTSEARELVYALAHHGAEIALVYRPEDHLRARHISQRIRAGSRQCLLIPVPAQQRVPRRTVHRVIDHFGHLDIFIDRSVALQGDGYEENVLFPSSHLMAAAMNRLVSS